MPSVLVIVVHIRCVAVFVSFVVMYANGYALILDNVMSTIAIHMRLPTVSLKMIRATSEVATISKLFNNEAFAGVVMESPAINAMGAAISRMIIATT